MSSGDESDAETISTEMLEDIRDGSQSHPSVNRRDSCYKISGCIKWSQAEWKIGLHKVFKAVVNDISQFLPFFGESISEVSCFIPEPQNFAEVTRL